MSSHFSPPTTVFRRMTSVSSDSEDSGVDPSYRQERKIFVGGVPSTVGPEELAHFFASYGPVEEAFIIYDRYSGRHRGFGFVTFYDMATTKAVCTTRVFCLHGRKVECKRALKREEILATNGFDFNDWKSFRPTEPSPRPSAPMTNNINPSLYFYSTPLGGWFVQPTMSVYPHQQFAVLPFSTIMWNHPSSSSPLIQEVLIPTSSSSMMNL